MRILIHTGKSVWSIGSRGVERVHNMDWKRASEAFEAMFRAQRIKTEQELQTTPLKIESRSAWKDLTDNTLP